MIKGSPIFITKTGKDIIMSVNTTMEYKGYKARIMEAERLVGDQVHGLPPGRPLPVYHSEEFVNYPENWMKGPGVFVVPVRAGKGLWWDWTLNDAANTAVLPTVKGCNPITGMQTSGFHLERYDTKCPKHNVEFQGDRYCPECGYRWPFGNYVAAPNTSWLDGMVNIKDGTVRQFFFTEDELRDVATHLIGKENTVPAFGFAFYKPKVPRPAQVALYRGSISDVELKVWPPLHTTGYSWPPLWPPLHTTGYSWPPLWETCTTSTTLGDKITDGGIISSGSDSSVSYSCDSINVKKSNTSQVYFASAAPMAYAPDQTNKSVESLRCSNSESVRGLARTEPVKEVSIGAGAKIKQTLAPDPNMLDTWCDTPDAVMTIYFVFQEKFEELKAGGMKNLEGTPEGMLEGIPVG